MRKSDLQDCLIACLVSEEGNICYWPVTEDGELGEVMFDRVPGKVTTSRESLAIQAKAPRKPSPWRACTVRNTSSLVFQPSPFDNICRSLYDTAVHDTA